MSNYLGDFLEDADVYIPFDTADATGASITATIVVADIEVYRQNTGAINLTQRSSTTGFTLDVDHDAMTGTHMVAIDTSDNTDAGFFTTGYDYFVKLNTVTVDGITVSKWIGQFSIENRFNVLTKQMVESYAYFSAVPTPAQALMGIYQHLGDFTISGTRVSIRSIAGTEEIALELDSATNPTSANRIVTV